MSIPHRNWNTVPEVAEQVAAVLEKQKEQTEIVRARFGQYAEAVLDAALTAELVAETPKRVQPEFQGAIAQYAQTQGRTTAWAVVQAAAEVVEHAWKRRVKRRGAQAIGWRASQGAWMRRWNWYRFGRWEHERCGI